MVENNIIYIILHIITTIKYDFYIFETIKHQVFKPLKYL